MRTCTVLLVPLFIFTTSCREKVALDPAEPLEEVTDGPESLALVTADSLEIAVYWHKTAQNAPTIVLYHQGGSNARGEYGPIIPKLTDKGFNVLAVDQRSGGQRYGSYNKTVADIAINRYHYCDALPDMVRALEYAKEEAEGDIILWGSSYSAMLVLQVAQENPERIAGVLSFSPASGPPMKECQPEPYLETLDLPVLVLKPQSEMDSERSVNQQLIAQSKGHPFFIAKNGVHGSSMLVAERTGSPVIDTWNVVNSFLDNVVAGEDVNDLLD